MPKDTKVTLSAGGESVETTVGGLEELAQAMADTYAVHATTGEEVFVKREQLEELLERFPELRRPGMRQVTQIVRKQGKAGERWGVTMAWITATKSGIPDAREETVWVGETVAGRLRTMAADIATFAAKEAGLELEGLEVWLTKLVPGTPAGFELVVRKLGDGSGGLSGAAKYTFKLYPKKALAELLLDFEVRARSLMAGGERVVQAELALGNG